MRRGLSCSTHLPAYDGYRACLLAVSFAARGSGLGCSTSGRLPHLTRVGAARAFPLRACPLPPPPPPPPRVRRFHPRKFATEPLRSCPFSSSYCRCQLLSPSRGSAYAPTRCACHQPCLVAACLRVSQAVHSLCPSSLSALG